MLTETEEEEEGRIMDYEDSNLMMDNKRVLSLFELCQMFAFAFGNGMLLSSYFIVTLPIESKLISKSASATYLAGFIGLAGLTQLICPIVGLLSDRCAHKWGKRRPFIFYGGIVGVGGLFIQWFSRTNDIYILYAFAFVVSMLALNTIYSAMNGLISDFVAEEQVGQANGIIAMLSVSGAISSFGVYRLIDNLGLFYWFYMAVIASTVLITFLAADYPENRSALYGASSGDLTFDEIKDAFYISPTKHRDFFLVFVSRTLYYMGISSQAYLMYYLHDIIKLDEEKAEAFTATLAVVGQCCGILTALPVGMLSDKLSNGRKKYIYISCAILAIANASFIFATDLTMVVVITCFIGAANGAYLTMDGSLAIDALPSKDEAARFMGIWGVGAFIGTAVGPLIGGPALWLSLQEDGSYGYAGYTFLLGLSAFYMVASAYVLKFTTID